MSIKCGWYHTVCLLEDGTIECFGDNNENQLDIKYKDITNVKTNRFDYLLK